MPGRLGGVRGTADRRISLDDFTVKNLATGAVLKAQPVPEHLLAMMQNGGLYPLLEKQGYIAPKAKSASAPARH